MFCKNCAEVLTDTDVTCPKCGFAAGTGMKYCAVCGEEIPVGAPVCEMCGTKVDTVPGGFQQQAAFQQQPQFQQQGQFQQQPQFQQPYQNAQAFGGQQAGGYPQQPYMQRGMPAQQAFQQPYQQGMGQMPVYSAAEQKSKVAAGLLGIFLGALGVHNFYLGYTSKAVVQLLLTLLSCGALGVVSEIWGLIEGIQILTGAINTDAKGIPLKD